MEGFTSGACCDWGAFDWLALGCGWAAEEGGLDFEVGGCSDEDC